MYVCANCEDTMLQDINKSAAVCCTDFAGVMMLSSGKGVPAHHLPIIHLEPKVIRLLKKSAIAGNFGAEAFPETQSAISRRNTEATDCKGISKHGQCRIGYAGEQISISVLPLNCQP